MPTEQEKVKAYYTKVRTYYAGISGPGAYCHLGDDNSLTLHVRTNMDTLPCEIWEASGPLLSSIEYIHEHAAEVLASYNRFHRTNFNTIIIDEEGIPLENES